MIKRVCDDCKNLLIGEYEQGDETREYCRCIHGEDLASWTFIKCSHFNPKPKVSNELKERRIKALQSGKEPRNKRKPMYASNAMGKSEI